MRLLLGPPLLSAALLFTGCFPHRSPSRLRSFDTDYLDALFRFRPSLASRMGVHQYDGRLDDLSPLAVARRADELGRLLIRLQTLQGAELGPEESAESKVLEYAIRGELAQWSHFELWRKDPLLYLEVPLAALDFLMTSDHAPAAERLRAAVIAVNEMEAVMAALRGNVTGAPAPLLAEALDRGRRLEMLVGTDLREWARRTAVIDMTLQRSFETGSEFALNAVRETLAWLRAEERAKGAGDGSLGAEGLMTRILLESMVEIRLSELEAMAEESWTKDAAAFERAAGEVAPGRGAHAALRAALGAPVPEAERLDLGRRAVDAVHAFVRRSGILERPEELGGESGLRLTIMPSYQRTVIDPYRLSPPLVREGSPPAAFWGLGAAEADWPAEDAAALESQLSEPEIRLAAIHDVMPGLHLHALRTAAYRSGLDRLPPERVLADRITKEGWAHYAEQMLWEEGFDKGDGRLELLLWRRALVRDCRFAAGLRMHARGMTLDDAAAMFRDRAFLPPAAAAGEARRVAADPLCLGEALGKALILRLREEVRRREGGAFRLSAFHEEFLRYAPLPLPLIRAALLADKP